MRDRVWNGSFYRWTEPFLYFVTLNTPLIAGYAPIRRRMTSYDTSEFYVDILCQVVFRFVDKHFLVNESFPQSFRQRKIPTRSWLVTGPLWEMISYRWVLLLVRIEKVTRTRRGHDSWPTVLNHLAWCELLRRFHVFSRLSPGNPPILRLIPK
jgi:hypothetical protein